MRNINIKILINRVEYSMTDDLAYIKDYLFKRGVAVHWSIVATDLTGYHITTTVNPFGNEQNILTGAEPLVKPYLSPSDDIVAFCIQGWKEFGVNMPSESEDRQYITGTKTVFLSINADDIFYNEVPNWRIWFLHEIMHALCTIANNEGYEAVDSMDTLIVSNGQRFFYYLNYDPENPNSNFIRTFESLYHTGWLKYV